MSLMEMTIPMAGAFAARPGAPGSATVSMRHAGSAGPSGHGAPEADEWRIRCHDVVSRERCLTVLVDKGRVLLVGPPGETAVLTTEQLDQLRNALEEAAVRVERQR